MSKERLCNAEFDKTNIFCFTDCFPKAAEAVRSHQLQNDLLTFLLINRLCRFDGFLWNMVRTFPEQIYKKIAIEINENTDTLLEIDALWLTLHSSFASTIAFHSRLIRWNVSQSFWSWSLLRACAFPFRKRSMPFSRHLEFFLSCKRIFLY